MGNMRRGEAPGGSRQESRARSRLTESVTGEALSRGRFSSRAGRTDDVNITQGGDADRRSGIVARRSMASLKCYDLFAGLSRQGHGQAVDPAATLRELMDVDFRDVEPAAL